LLLLLLLFPCVRSHFLLGCTASIRQVSQATHYCNLAFETFILVWRMEKRLRVTSTDFLT
jgi:hypothetical protein